MRRVERFNSASEIFFKAEAAIRRLKRDIPSCKEQYQGDPLIGDGGMPRCDNPDECCDACKRRFELSQAIGEWRRTRRNAMRRALRAVEASNLQEASPGFPAGDAV